MSGKAMVPDYVVSPGEILEEILESQGLTKVEFAERCGRSAKFVSEVVAGKAPITEESALQFARVLGIEAEFWTNLEMNYRLRLAEMDEEARFAELKEWTERFPVRQMAAMGLIQKVKGVPETVRELLGFFGVATSEAMDDVLRNRSQNVAYRRSASFQGEPEAVLAWLRWGEAIARRMELGEFEPARFRDCLREVRALTTQTSEGLPADLVPMCARSGVALVCVPELPGTRLSGATRWCGDNPVIQLSLRHKSDDHFWFTFYHEAAHVLLHGKKGVFIDDAKNDAKDPREIEANEFAANALVPRPELAAFIGIGRTDEHAVASFAQRLGIAPGIVVGQLQHAGVLPYKSTLNKLKVRFHWVN